MVGPDDIRVMLAEDFELNAQACLKALNCPDIMALTSPSHVVDGQIVEAKCSGRVRGPQSILKDGQGLLEVLFGCVMLTQIAAGRPHVHEGGGRQAVSAAMGAFECGQRFFELVEGRIGVSQLLLVHAQVVESGRCLWMARTEHLDAIGNHLFAERHGHFVLVECSIGQL